MTEEKKGFSLEKMRYLPDLIAGIALVVIICLETAQCIDRYCFRQTLLFVDDIVVICFSWAVFVGAAAAYRRKMHYGLEVIINRFGPRAKPYYVAIVQLLATGLFAYLTYRSVILYIKSGSKILATTRISYKWVDAGAIVGFALMTIYGLEFFIEDIKNIRAMKEEKA